MPLYVERMERTIAILVVLSVRESRSAVLESVLARTSRAQQNAVSLSHVMAKIVKVIRRCA